MTPPKPQEQKDWVLVPREPTEAMLVAGDEGSMLELAGDFTYEERARIAHAERRLREYADAYRAMLNSAPPPAMESEREGFEAWAVSKFYNITAAEVSPALWSYVDETTVNAFAGWNARSARTTDAGAREAAIAVLKSEYIRFERSESGAPTSDAVSFVTAIIAAHTSAQAALPTLTEGEDYTLEKMQSLNILIPKSVEESGDLAMLQAMMNTLIRERAEAVAIIDRLTGQRP